MKINKLFTSLIVLIVFLFLNQIVSAQSDFEKVKNFETRFKQLNEAIKNAATLDECSTIAEGITQLKTDYTPYKALLDKSMYPDNFDASFAKIEKALEVRKGDFSQIVELKTEVGTLKDKVSDLSQQNQSLISQIRVLQIQSTKDASTIASLTKLVAQLKANIAQRDELVRGIVDSLLQQFVKTPGSLNDAEKQAVFKKIDNGNLFFNIERTISDNIQFMKVTQMKPEDLSKMKEEFKDFNKTWRQIGPKLAEIYLTRKDKAQEIANIDNMFADWSARLNDEMWGQVNKLFREKKLAVLPFKSGDQFVSSVNAFIDDEIKNYDVKGSTESKNTFYMFTDSVYFKSVKPVWVPILIENGMMTSANKDSVEKQIAVWKEKVAPSSGMNYIYIAGAVVIVALIVAYFLKGRKKKIVYIDAQNETQDKTE
jgi:hypothetical protein